VVQQQQVQVPYILQYIHIMIYRYSTGTLSRLRLFFLLAIFAAERRKKGSIMKHHEAA
jgi:hypothetical protein